MAATAATTPVLYEKAPAYASEFDLLVACCTNSSSRGPADRIREGLSSPLDWPRLLDLVDHHRVVPQVYGALSALSYLVPSQPLNALRSRYQDNARNALWFTAELARILNHLEAGGIKAMPFKGPVLAQTLYGEVTGRQFGDLDILILPADVPKAKGALLALGYQCEPQLRPQDEPAYLASGCGYVFHSPAGRNLLDLQWRIVPRFYSIDFEVADLLKRADEIVVNGCPMRTLRPEDLLLVLCVHAAKHVWTQLSWLCDIAQLAKSRCLDWNAIQDEANRLGIERIVNLNLLLAHKLLGSPLPKPTCHSERSEESVVGRNRETADAILRIIERSTPCDTESLPYFRLMLRLRERRQDQARFLWRLTVTPSVSEWSAVRLPKPLQPLYRLVRLSRLVKRLLPRDQARVAQSSDARLQKPLDSFTQTRPDLAQK